MFLNEKNLWCDKFYYILLIIGVLLYSACGNKECYKDSGHTRKFFPLETPTFTSTTEFGGCGIPENPAGLMFINNDDIGAVFDVCNGVNDPNSRATDFKMELDFSGPCANRDIYTETFSPDRGNTVCGTPGRSMFVTSTNLGSALVLCPDPHRADNHATADYEVALIIESKHYSSEGNTAGTCSNCESRSYTVFFRTDMLFESVGFNEVTSCSSPFAMIGPFSTYPECTFN